MPYFQKIHIMGVTGDSAELKFNVAGQPRAHFSVFVEEYWRDQQTGDRKSLTTIFRCTAFNKMATSAARVLKKGTWIFVEGRMRCREKNGVDYWSMTVDGFRKLDPRQHHEPPGPEDESQEPANTHGE